MTVRVFVACTPAERLPMRVLEFSLRETSRLPVEVAAIHDFDRAKALPRPADLRNQPRTPFSFQRFLIPELCAWRGRAIYLDADMQVLQDIGSLWNAPMGEHDLLTVEEGTAGRKGQFSVMLLDCARLRWDVDAIVRGLDEGRYTYEQLMHGMCVAGSVGRILPAAWNSLERYEPGVTCLVHYTDMNTQPWVSLANPLGSLWLQCLRRAMSAGVLSADDLAREIAQGHVRPSLLPQALGHDLPMAQLRAMDRTFQAPYRSIRSGSSSPWIGWRAGVLAAARGGWRRVRELAPW